MYCVLLHIDIEKKFLEDYHYTSDILEGWADSAPPVTSLTCIPTPKTRTKRYITDIM